VARFDGSDAFERVATLVLEREISEAIDGRNSNIAMLALGYARSIVTRFNLDWAAT